MLPFAADWRWLIDRPDTPWYPSLRLFHQKPPGDSAASGGGGDAGICGARRPGPAEAHRNLGHILKEQGRLEAAIASYREAAAARSDHAGAARELGVALHAAGSFRRVLSVRPDDAAALTNLSIRRALPNFPIATN